MLTSTLLGHKFKNPLMNAAGVLCTSEEELNAMGSSSAGTQITKSCTEKYREGNPSPRFSSAPYGTINSMGLPNNGFQFYKDYVLTHKPKDGHPIFFSVSGMSMDESVRLAKELNLLGKDGTVILELNLSCPNLPGKPQVGYDLTDMDVYLTAVSAVYEMPFGVKLPPYLDMAHFDAAAEVLNKHQKVAFLTCINSIGNGLIIDVEKEQVLVKPKNGFGGVGGHYVLPTALANVNAFYRRCPLKQIIGCGGVTEGSEVFMHILAGASMVQVGSQLWEEGPQLFDRLIEELAELMVKKGYKSIEDFHGKLKTIE